MYNSFQLLLKYISYYFNASNGKGHGIHSPFVFDFVTKVLNDKKKYQGYDEIEKLRKKLLSDDKIIDVRDFGAGSSIVKTNKRKISEIASSSLKSKKYARLLHRIVKYFDAKYIVELGTSLGITTSYMACAVPQSKIVSLEGDEAIASIAEGNFQQLSLSHIKIAKGDFDTSLQNPYLLEAKPDLVYIDGNHKKEPTLKYFNFFLEKGDENTVMIFDDIHWSKGMEEAWSDIKKDPRVTLTIDLFFIGLVFFKKEFKAKQDFIVRF